MNRQAEIPNIAQSSAGHGIDRLVGLTDLTERPGYDPRLWGRVALWQSAWRYMHDFPDRRKAEAFVADVCAAVNWLSPKILRRRDVEELRR
jgi:hypothetical protein